MVGSEFWLRKISCDDRTLSDLKTNLVDCTQAVVIELFYLWNENKNPCLIAYKDSTRTVMVHLSILKFF